MTSSAQRRPSSQGTARTPQRKASTGSWLGSLLKKLLVGGLVLLLVGALAFLVAYRTIDIPVANADFKTETTLVYYDDGKTELGRFAEQNRIPIDLEKIPQDMKDAVVAAENRTFWTDQGIDPKGILRAAFSNAQGNETQGASTITQQYVKVLYLSSERSFQRKFKEAIISLKIQREQSKEEILEGYLNTIYFGRGAYGVQAAAQAFFNTDATRLNLRQSAVLATVLNSPSQYDPANGKRARRELRDRYGSVLDGMVEMGTISAGQADKAGKRLPDFPEIEAESRYGGQRGHMLSLVRKELLALGFDEQEIDGGGLRVTTTLNQQAMTTIRDSVAEQRPEGFGDKELHVGAATVEVGTGALKGFYGGQDYLDSQINWAATDGMAGSTFKAYTVAAALEQGFSLQNTFEGNSPLEVYDLLVNNSGEGGGDNYGSAVTLEYATQKSINTAFVDLTDQMDDGPEAIYNTALALGIPPEKPRKKYPGIPDKSIDLADDDFLFTLGRARVSPINMANSYASIANGGEKADVHVITKVVDTDGQERYNHKTSTERAIDEDVAADTSYALQQVVSGGTGVAAGALGRPAAGKTGTATNAQDQVSSAWYVGYTPQLSTAVMYLRGDGDDQLDGWLPSYFGADYPLDTWLSIMTTLMADRPVEDFPPPANLDGDAPGEEDSVYVPPETTYTPTQEPSSTGTGSPTKKPSKKPTNRPTKSPTRSPTQSPTQSPSPTESSTLPTAPPSSSSPGGGGGGG